MNWKQIRQERQRVGRPFVIAHGGASAIAPENTLKSFSLALGQGADMLETDLRFTQDGEIVLIHDKTLDRTTNGHGLVSNTTLRDIKRYRIKASVGQEPCDEQVPTLRELITLTKASMPLLLELKDPLFGKKERARRLVDLLTELGVLEKSAIVSFHLAFLWSVREACPSIPIGYITKHNPLPIQTTQLLGPFWPLLLINPSYVTWAHRWNGLVCPLDPNPEPRMRLYLRLGVDAVLANHPARALTVIKESLRPNP